MASNPSFICEELIRLFHAFRVVELEPILGHTFLKIGSNLNFEDLSAINDWLSDEGEAIQELFNNDGKQAGMEYLENKYQSVPVEGEVRIFHSKNDNNVWRMIPLNSPTYQEIISALENLSLCYFDGIVTVYNNDIFVVEDDDIFTVEDDLSDKDERKDSEEKIPSVEGICMFEKGNLDAEMLEPSTEEDSDSEDDSHLNPSVDLNDEN